MGRAIAVMEGAGALVASALMSLLVIITFIDVIGRQFGYPLGFAFEFTQMSVALMFYVTLPLVTWRREHITVDLLPAPGSNWQGHGLEAVMDLLAAFLIGIGAVQLWEQGETLQTFNTVMMFTRIPLAPLVFFMSALAGVTAAVCVVHAVARLRTAVAVWNEKAG